MLLTQSDRDRLVTLLKTYTPPGLPGTARLELHTAVKAADIVSPSAMPATVVTMNSVVSLIDLANGLIRTCTLVYPGDANVDRLKISVLAPLGAALLGRSEGEVIEFTVPVGMKRFFIQKVLYQPEAQLNQLNQLPHGTTAA
jgi:regulator of nucleoside diphosphate kinase